MSKAMKTLLTLAMLLGLSISALARYVGSLDGLLHEDNGAVVLADLQAGAFVNSHGFLVNPDSSLVTSGGAALPTATSSVLGGVKPDGTSILNTAGAISATAASVGAAASTSKFIVQGTTDAGLSAAQFLGALPSGHLWNNNTTGVLTTASPAPYASGTVTASISAATLCTTTDCPAGTYLVSVYANEAGGTGCTTVTSGIVKVELNYIDNQATRSAVVIPLTNSAGTGSMGVSMALTTTGLAYSMGQYVVNTTGSAVGGSGSIQILTAVTACATPGSWSGYQLRAYVTRIG